LKSRGQIAAQLSHGRRMPAPRRLLLSRVVVPADGQLPPVALTARWCSMGNRATGILEQISEELKAWAQTLPDEWYGSRTEKDYRLAVLQFAAEIGRLQSFFSDRYTEGSLSVALMEYPEGEWIELADGSSEWRWCDPENPAK